jgi:hypothetical protein
MAGELPMMFWLLFMGAKNQPLAAASACLRQAPASSQRA